MDDSVFIELQRLFRLVHERSLHELAVTRPDFAISVTAVQRGNVVLVPGMHATAPVFEEAEEVVKAEGYAITSPLVGIFYRSPSPDAAPFIEVGDTVEVGDVIGIIEAMKVFNEITADHAGKVVAISADNGTLVQSGQPLVILDVDA